MARSFRVSKKWQPLVTVAVVVLVLGAISTLFAGIMSNDRKRISTLGFKVGDLDETGAFVESDTAIYTKDAFSCEGLRIEPAFESNLTYDVYYYDVNGKLLDSKLGLVDIFEEDYPMADKARVVIHPAKPADVKASEWAIRFWEVEGYADDLKITVNKKQVDYETSKDLYVEGDSGTFVVGADNKIESKVDASMKSSAVIEIGDKSYTYYRIYVRNNDANAPAAVVAFAEADGVAFAYNEKGKLEEGILAYTFNADTMLKDTWYSVLVEAPADATMLRVAAASGADVRIYGVSEK